MVNDAKSSIIPKRKAKDEFTSVPVPLDKHSHNNTATLHITEGFAACQTNIEEIQWPGTGTKDI